MTDAGPSPENTIANLVRLNKERKEQLRVANERKLRECTAAFGELSAALVEGVNRDASEVFSNQQLLEQQTKELQVQADKFLKQSQRWVELFDGFNSSLKELGDVANWARVIEGDARETVRALSSLHDARRQLRTGQSGGA
eukprot:TRINITY_DN71541_c0_g1_i1.p2 TRINITY_DN71541_c0_g1~~TRINITY_DN71541_c0_g1_i1.p2  ORF type:complete len:165 (+),score=77.22 TRINITY_DN71541_c0_g1_i1:75-497(+)